MKNLIRLLQRYNYEYSHTVSRNLLEFKIDLEGYGAISCTFDYNSNIYIIMFEISEEEYSGLFFVDIDQITDEELKEWNTINKFTTVNQAYKDIIDRIDVINSECGGVLDTSSEFALEIDNLLKLL